MDIVHLRCFVAVAEELNFTRAAARVHLEPSPLSRRVRQFELELSGSLFVRSSHAVALTALGERLLPHAREILARFDKLADLPTEDPSSMALQIGVAPGIHPEARDWTLSVLRSTSPDSAAQLDAGGTTGLIKRVFDGALDMAFVHDAVASDSIFSLAVTVERLGVAVAADDPRAAAPHLRLDELTEIAYLTSAEHTAPLFLAGVTTTLSAAGVRMRRLPPYDLTQVGHMVAAGMGFVLSPLDRRSPLRHIYESAGARVVPLTGVELALTTSLIWSIDRAGVDPALAALAAGAKAACPRPLQL